VSIRFDSRGGRSKRACQYVLCLSVPNNFAPSAGARARARRLVAVVAPSGHWRCGMFSSRAQHDPTRRVGKASQFHERREQGPAVPPEPKARRVSQAPRVSKANPSRRPADPTAEQGPTGPEAHLVLRLRPQRRKLQEHRSSTAAVPARSQGRCCGGLDNCGALPAPQPFSKCATLI
jgi:hypothetical protein